MMSKQGTETLTGTYTVTGNNLTATFDGMTIRGTFSTNSTSGTWRDGEGNSGNFSGNRV